MIQQVVKYERKPRMDAGLNEGLFDWSGYILKAAAVRWDS